MDLKTQLSASGSGAVIVGSLIEFANTVPGPMTLPTDGSSFDTASFPELAKVYANGKLPVVVGTNVMVISGVNTKPTYSSSKWRVT